MTLLPGLAKPSVKTVIDHEPVPQNRMVVVTVPGRQSHRDGQEARTLRRNIQAVHVGPSHDLGECFEMRVRIESKGVSTTGAAILA